jgi:hypothetical protein
MVTVENRGRKIKSAWSISSDGSDVLVGAVDQ